ncbi:multicopper oxidase family protein [Allopontixanthobacter sp.]|uniref:multicopper oxidase family protein n=1 Tax=Allopontixanthobacter sp. TaxID=2906452 RepID=UPI002ABA97FE|nr:multicopper oxidase family protein [Allopontixanthobacter sp.]MDZ4307324.1 multicopper oxidase family protein [Allopontixanthobacter sp.]
MEKSAFSMLVSVAMAAALQLHGAASARSGSGSGSSAYELSVERVQSQIYNPWTQEMDVVELRAFRNEGADRLVAPVMRISPGEVLKLDVENNLPPCEPGDIEKIACFNSTNIHTHGLWVSPSGNSDNVMIEIHPGQRFDYEFAIPEDHPAGTFWYHPHMHGSTSVQLGSGMAGALIVDGDRIPTLSAPGDVDILFPSQGGAAFGEQIWVFSQIQYACFDEGGQIIASASNAAWSCAKGVVGSVERWSQFGRDEELGSGRFIGINGEVQPTLTGVETGLFQRLRLIHAGLRRPVKMNIRRLAIGAPELRGVPAEKQMEWIAEYCTGEQVELFHFADDGLTRKAIRRVDKAVMYPGSRFDALAYFKQPGLYCLVNDQTDPSNSDDRSVLGILKVSGEAVAVADIAAHLTETLTNAAEQRISDARVRSRVISDLSNELQIKSFTWHSPVIEDEITGYQTAKMSILEQDDGSFAFSIDGNTFEHGRIDRTLTLGDVEEWEITSGEGSHPFHIHVNPFEIISIRDGQGRDVTRKESEAYDADYAGMIGGWRDTVMVKPAYKVIMRTRYRRFVGDFVMHCHFASHGDRGMMQAIRMVMPGPHAEHQAVH